MTHVAGHCCGVGETCEPPELPEIPVVIHNCKHANIAIALKRWPGEADAHFEHRDQQLLAIISHIARLATPPGEKVDMYTFPLSYVHPEP